MADARHAEQLKIMRLHMRKNQDEAKEAKERLRIERDDRRETERTLQQVTNNVGELTCITASQQTMMHGSWSSLNVTGLTWTA